MAKSLENIRIVEGVLFLAAFALCIPAANWMIGHVGTYCVPAGPCVIPVAPGVLAPSGVVTVGLAFVFRDLVQRRLGWKAAAAGIFAGTLLSALIAPAPLVVASAAAFFVSETADMLIYTPLQKKKLVLAVAVSSGVGLVIDSIVFLWLAFGSLTFLNGQIIGKAWMVLLVLPAIVLLRRRDERLGLKPV